MILALSALAKATIGRATVRRALTSLAAFILGLACVSAAPQAAAPAQGVVIDAKTRAPIPAAIVTIGGRALRADAHGAFPSPASGASVAARAPGYLRTRTSIASDAPVTLALTPFRPKAVYLSVFGVTSRTLRNAAVALQATNGINAFVIDAKGDRGLTPWRDARRTAIGAIRHVSAQPPYIDDFAALVAALHEQGFYLIARIVVFKDDPLASAHPEWAVRDAAGGVWRDRESLQWVDPFRHEIWAHNIDIAEEAARLGFDEIQFDYVRFPDAPGLRFSAPNTRANRTAAIVGFLDAARARLAPYNVFVAADIFGYVCWNLDDTAIGQQL